MADVPILHSRRAQWAALLTVLLSFALLIGIGLWHEREQTVRVEQEHLSAQARTVKVNVVRQLVGVDAALRSVVRDLEYFEGQRGNDFSSLNRRLQSLTEAMPGVRTLSLLDGAGTVLASNRTELVGQNFSRREYVQSVLRAPDPNAVYLSKPFKTVLNVYSMNMVRVVLSTPRDVHRIVAATLDPEFFELLLSSVRYAEDMWVALVHAEGQLTVHQPPRPDLLGANLATVGGFFSRHMASGELATFFSGRVVARGEQAWIAQRTVEAASINLKGGLVIAVARQPSEVLRDWSRLVLVSALAWAMLSIAAAAALRLVQRDHDLVLRYEREKELLRREADEEVRHMAFYDALTELPNRRLLLDRLAQVQSASLRHGYLSALMFLDLDGFKQLNDNHGHDMGDLLLQEVAQRLKGCVREEDTLCRWAGDEFVVMLTNLGSGQLDARERVEIVVRKVLAKLSQEYELGDLRYRCTASVGVVLFGDNNVPQDDILRSADQAMYQAKSQGRNTFRWASEECVVLGQATTLAPKSVDHA